MLALPAAMAWGGLDTLESLSLSHPGSVACLAFGLLGPTGETLGRRLSGRDYPPPAHLAASALVWALHGLAASLLYWVLNSGVVLAQGVGFLPGGGYGSGPGLLRAFFSSFFFTGPLFTSILVCLGLTPVLTALQRLALAALDFKLDRGRWPGLALASWKADWPAFIQYNLTSGPLVRIPLMTIVFMLPQGLWLLTAAWCLALAGALEGWGNKKSR